MAVNLVASKSDPPVAALVVANLVRSNVCVSVTWGSKTTMSFSNLTLDSTANICRYLARVAPDEWLYGKNNLERTEIDHWLMFGYGPLSSQNKFENAVLSLNQGLGPATYLVGNQFTLADACIWGILYKSKEWIRIMNSETPPVNAVRWYKFVDTLDFVRPLISSLPELADLPGSLFNRGCKILPDEKSGKSVTACRHKDDASKIKDEGKFVELPDAEKGKVVVRFPPEASGYLHIGHAKAALLNQYYKDAYEGKLIMRFDDTNPAKEKIDFEQVILEDLKLLKITPDEFTHTSNYFDGMLKMCETLLSKGLAYADDTDAETMKLEREQRTESKNRNNAVEQNLKMWSEMKAGTEAGQKCCVRAKIDMNSANGCMRDPTIYRCKNEAHPRTGNKYKVYPTYDFACPIVDSLEGVTHCLRTMEYHDRDEQFYWFIDVLGLRKPYIWEYSRLNMMNTVLSKRKLTWFVDEGLVDGWDDPRFPTVRGVLRRGMTVEGLKQFIVAQGSSRSVVLMEWDKIWAFNKKVIDPVAPRYTSLSVDTVPVLVKDATLEPLEVPVHPKDPNIGKKVIWVGPRVLIDREDAETLKEGENATFINWGNLMVKKIIRKDGKIESVETEPNLQNTDYKKTIKLTWLAETDKAPFVPTVCVYFDHIISKAVLGKDEDFKSFINTNTRKEVTMLGDPELLKIKKSDIIQLQRRGFFICDREYSPPSKHTGREVPIVLIYIPDGRAKEQATSGAPKDVQSTLKEKPPRPSSVSIAPKEAEPIAISHVASLSGFDGEAINKSILAQGDVIRKLKSEKADKDTIAKEVTVLLKLKSDFKIATGTDWKQGIKLPLSSSSITAAAEKQSTSESTINSQKQSSSESLHKQIVEQGDKVRNLKSQKATKDIIQAEVKTLLALKAEFKSATGLDWTPGMTLPSTGTTDVTSAQSTSDVASAQSTSDVASAQSTSDVASAQSTSDVASAQSTSDVTSAQSTSDGGSLNQKIVEQGDKIRGLKSQKAEKNVIDSEVKILLSLKAEYKQVTGKDWKPSSGPAVGRVSPPKAQTVPTTKTSHQKGLIGEITRQISKLEDKKSKKVPANVLDDEHEVLLNLQSEFNSITGKEWGGESDPVSSFAQAVAAQGEQVRQLKSTGVEKALIEEQVKKLLKMKVDYKILSGEDYVASGSGSLRPKAEKKKATPVKGKEKSTPASTDEGSKKQTRLGLEATKEDNLPEWYSQVITKGELIEYYDVSGCYIYRPWSFAIWEFIKDFFDGEIKNLGVQNCYFPLFVSRSVLEKEKTHIADFAPEVAWVTKSGDSDLAEPIAVRPTSETVMYPAYAKWIQSYRDLPIKLNQWNNVVRWEFKHPQPFLRTREFLWQEGHTAYADKKEAEEEVLAILDLYAQVYTNLLAIPVIKGRKTEKEKFAGGDYTTTVEAFISASGRAIQGATSHHLGQNFSKMFEITYEDPETQEKKFVYQNSWGITTRTIGVMIMIHADNQGLVLPPRVASIQVVIVPCGIVAAMKSEDKAALQASCVALEEELKESGIRVFGDYRENYSPGWRFNHWELKGVPVRIEYGPKDIAKQQIIAVRRDTGDKITYSRNSAVTDVSSLLEKIQSNLLSRAEQDLKSHTVISHDWNEFCKKLDEKNIILSPFCGDEVCEEQIKKESAREDLEADAGAPAMGAKSLCSPFNQPAEITTADKCINPSCKIKPKQYTLFGRSY